MYIVKLSAHGNIDHAQGPSAEIADPKFAKVETFDAALKVAYDYIQENCLGAGNWTGGFVYLESTGDCIGWISYNNRFWPHGSKVFEERIGCWNA